MKTKSNAIAAALLLFTLGLISEAALATIKTRRHSGKTIGVGAILGSPTGLSANLLRPKNRSIDLALAFDLTGDRDFFAHSTYLFRHPRSIDMDGVKLGWFYGVGAQLLVYESKARESNDRARLGPRGSVGFNYVPPRSAPVELFGQVGLAMYVLPKTEADFDIGIGGRFYF